MDYREGMQVLRAARLFAPSIVFYQGQYHVFSRTTRVSFGGDIEEALDRGGFLIAKNAPTNLYVAANFNVIKGAETVATTRSRTMASRIANALNEYTPGDRGY
jgi:hypothetical protein